MMNMNISGYNEKLIRFHDWRNELNIVNKVLLALSFALFTGLMAQVRFSLPFSPVPITGQTFAVLLAGVMLGRWGGMSMSMYVGLGAAGIPWFTKFQGGLATLTGATGGFLIGFIFAALFVGYMTEKHVSSRKIYNIIPLMAFANFILIYIPGSIVLYFWWNAAIGPVSIMSLMAVGVIPFVAGDLLKISAASAAARMLLPLR
jgi:biotin transport system substrate-specific component